VTDPTGESKERNREIAANESARQTTSSIRVSVWAVAVAVVIGLLAVGWVMINNK
jgi:cobalamin biosynthesis Mg chelatase CobN